ncbi:hypothetical protein CF326_g3658 [Tilletia indica]|nr:hypothetical protein CF326_g3658 [Tilletia indica]
MAISTDSPKQFSFLWRALVFAPVTLLRLYSRVHPKEKIEGVEWEEIEIPSRDAGRSIKAIRYFRTGDKNRQGPRDVLLNFHGSGWVLHHWGMDHQYAGVIVKALDIDFYDMDYRKGPEYPFPAAHEDVEDAVLHFANTENTKSLSTSGFSAGANMAISGPAHVKEKLAQSRIKELSSISVLYPPCDWSTTEVAPSKNCEGGGLLLPDPVIWLFNNCGAVSPNDWLSKRFSIAQLSVDEILTKHFLAITGDADHLHDGGVKFVKALKENGHPDATFISLKNAGHSFDKDPKTALARKYTASAYDSVIDNIRRGLGQGASAGGNVDDTLRQRKATGTS